MVIQSALQFVTLRRFVVDTHAAGGPASAPVEHGGEGGWVDVTIALRRGNGARTIGGLMRRLVGLAGKDDGL